MGVNKRETRFKVGDRVRIVDEPYNECPHIWIKEMTPYCGVEATVSKVWRYDKPEDDVYRIDADKGQFAWCENCFVQEPEVDIEESDKGLDFLFAN